LATVAALSPSSIVLVLKGGGKRKKKKKKKGTRVTSGDAVRLQISQQKKIKTRRGSRTGGRTGLIVVRGPAGSVLPSGKEEGGRKRQNILARNW